MKFFKTSSTSGRTNDIIIITSATLCIVLIGKLAQHVLAYE